LSYSVSGAARFYYASGLGIQGEVTLTITNESITTVVTTDSTAGTFVATVPAGTYTLSGIKDLWSFTSEAVVVTDADLSNQDIIGNPVSWEVLSYVQDSDITLLAVVSLESTATDKQASIVRVGTDANQDPLIQIAQPPYTTWTDITPPDTLFSVVWTDEDPPQAGDTGLIIIDTKGNKYTSDDLTTPTWTAVTAVQQYNSQTIDDYVDLAPASAIYGIASEGGLYKYTVAGSSWDDYTPGTPAANIISLTVMGPMMVAVGDEAVYQVKVSDGTATEKTIAVSETFQGIRLGDWGGFVVSAQGTILKLVSIDDTYVEVSGIPVALNGISLYNPSPAGSLVVGAQGLVMRHK